MPIGIGAYSAFVLLSATRQAPPLAIDGAVNNQCARDDCVNARRSRATIEVARRYDPIRPECSSYVD